MKRPIRWPCRCATARLPVALNIVDISTIGATLGKESVQRSMTAGIIGMIGVLLFMLIIYRLPGFIADLALASYVVFNIAVFKLIPVTLTLAGIAGFLLSIGMAVDANILIFERMKEELRVGRSLRLAVEAGFDRAWPAIRDGNLSTLDQLRCALLVRQHLRRQHRQGFRPDTGYRCGAFHVHCRLHYPNLHAHTSSGRDEKLADSRSLIGY